MQCPRTFLMCYISFCLFILFLVWVFLVFTAAHSLSLGATSGTCLSSWGLRASLVAGHSSGVPRPQQSLLQALQCMLSSYDAPAFSFLEICGIFPDQSLTHVPFIGREILNHWTTSGVLVLYFYLNQNFVNKNISNQELLL